MWLPDGYYYLHTNVASAKKLREFAAPAWFSRLEVIPLETQSKSKILMVLDGKRRDIKKRLLHDPPDS
jgi:hypothetical protein